MVSFVNAFIPCIMTAPIIQPINSPIVPVPPSTVESWNNITSVDSWNNVNSIESDSLNLLPTNQNPVSQNPLPTDEEESYNHEDYEEMSEDDEETNDSYTSASSEDTYEDLPELEEQTNPANFLEWRDRHIERNFCSYNEFHDYITAYNILYDEYFGMQALH